MFSFFKKKENQTNVPEWASFFTTKEYTRFMKYVDNYFRKLNVDYTIIDGGISVGENNFGFKVLGLQNVAQMCKQNTLGDYESIVTKHFDTMIRIYQFEKEFDEIVTDFEKVEKYITVRLYDNEYLSHLEEENRITQPFTEDIGAMLVFDLPESVMNIKPEQTLAWGKTKEELFQTGHKNVKNNYPVNLTKNKVGDHTIWFAEADHFFTSVFALDIIEYPQVIGSKGSVISFPNRHAVLIYPIENLEVLGALNVILYLTTRMYEDGPGSMTDKLYWYKDSQFINLPHRKEDGKQIFSPPQTFVDALNEMAKNK